MFILSSKASLSLLVLENIVGASAADDRAGGPSGSVSDRENWKVFATFPKVCEAGWLYKLCKLDLFSPECELELDPELNPEGTLFE